MTKETSQLLKGISILLMIFLHLFNQKENIELCSNLFYIGSKPLVSILVNCANPVPFFLILGGYGLYKAWLKGDKNRWWRICRLFVHYWLILVIFLSIGHYMNPDKYPGSIYIIIINFTAFNTSYNGEMWFLLPYVILSILAPFIFNNCKNINWIWIIGISLLINLFTSFCISRYGSSFLFSNMWVYNPLLVLHLSFSFCLGYVAAREGYFEKLKKFVQKTFKSQAVKNLMVWCSLILLIGIQMIFKYNYFYAFFFISLITLIKFPKWIGSSLVKLGNQSMNMWMIHTWFCYYLFHNFIYSFKYPILIFIVLTTISYLCSLVVNQIAKPIEKIFFTKKEIQQKPIL